MKWNSRARRKSADIVLGLFIVVSGVLLSFVSRGDTVTTSTSNILTSGFDVACFDYEVIGACLWMTCTPTGCDFDTSIRVSHNIPEVVATSYPILGQSPWPESEFMVSPTGFAEEGGASDEGGADVREQVLKFKNVDILGSPSTAFFLALGTTGSVPVCIPLTFPMNPHFISTLDPNWRDPVVETPWTMANLFTGISAGASRFAGLYPRIGFVKQNHDYKASLVAALRASHIVRQGGPHVYQSMGSSNRQGQWPPSSGTPFLWQQLVPYYMGCQYLPDIDDTLYITDPYASRLNQVNGNAWQLWRRYSCCEQKGAVLVAWF
ncbi:MAG: TIGR03756 family integrating conjugative element protein [Pseudomonadota bacterium]